MIKYRLLNIPLSLVSVLLMAGIAFGQPPVIKTKTGVILRLDAGGNYTVKVSDVATVSAGAQVTLSPSAFNCSKLGPQTVKITAARQQATFNLPNVITSDASGNLYVVQNDGAVRKISTSGTTTTLVPAYKYNTLLAPDGGVLLPNGDMYVTAFAAIEKITPAGIVSVFSGHPGYTDYTNTEGYIVGYSSPDGIVVNQSGTFYVADQGRHEIRKIAPDGYVTNFVGGGAIGFADGQGAAAVFTRPYGLAIDQQGNIYTADIDNQRIRKITPGGKVTTLAGTGAIGSNDGPGASATFNSPLGITIDAAGNLYVVDAGKKIRKITQAGFVSTLAGNDNLGDADGVGSAASFNTITNITIDAAGNLYVTDNGNNKIRKITPAGVVSTYAGSGERGDADGTNATPDPNDVSTAQVQVTVISNPVFETMPDVELAADITCQAKLPDYTKSAIVSPCADKLKITQSPAAGTIVSPAAAVTVTLTASDGFGGKGTTSFKVSLSATPVITPNSQPVVLTLDATGNYQVKLADVATVSPCNNPTITITPSAFTCADVGTKSVTVEAFVPAPAKFNYPAGMIYDASGNLFIVDRDNHVVRKLTPDGFVTTVAGTGAEGHVNAKGTAASFGDINAIALDSHGNLYVNDYKYADIRKIAPDGTVTTFASNIACNQMVMDKLDNLFVTTINACIKKITPDGVVSYFAGIETNGYLDATGTDARFSFVDGITIDASGNLYVLDYGNYKIRKITPNAVVTTLPVTGGFVPQGYLVLDASGNLFIASSDNVWERKANGECVAFAGSNIPSGPGNNDGTGTAARFNTVQGIVIDASGNFLVADAGDDAIRQITPDAVVTTYAGGIKGYANGTIKHGPTVSQQIPVTVKSSLAITTIYSDVMILLGTCPATMPDFIENATATDNCSNQIVFTQTPGAGTVLNPDETVKVTITATDNLNISVSKTFNVTATGNAPALSVKVSGPAAICSGTQATFTATPVNIVSPGYQWEVNGVLVGTNSPTFSSSTLGDQDVIICIVTAGQGCITPINSNAITVTVNTVYKPAVSIAVNGGGVCDGMPVAISATAVFAGTNPSYQWQVNGVNAGTNSATLSLVSILPADVVKCIITSDGPCPVIAESNTVTGINTIPKLTPAISIQSAVIEPVCSGTTVKFIASPLNEGTSPIYQWQVNGISKGSNSPEFTINDFAEGDQVTCVLTNTSSPCLTNTNAASNAIVIHVTPPSTLVPSVEVTPGGYGSCEGQSLTYTAIAIDAGNSPAYQWKVNGQNAGTNSFEFTSTTLKTGDKITCTVTSSVACSIATATSNEASLTADPTVSNSITITSSAVNNIITPGQQVTFTARAVITDNVAYQWMINGTGVSGSDNPVFTANGLLNNDVVTCSVTTYGKCIATPYVVSNALTMIIFVPVEIVNAFTPNGDGINDTWEIPSLQAYPACSVNIFTRYGALVYKSTGYVKAWDGTYAAKQVPAGTYYYIIDLKNGKDKISGAVTVLR